MLFIINVSGNTLLNNITTINSSLNVSGNTVLNNITTMNNSLTVNGNTTGGLVNVIQNMMWNDGVLLCVKCNWLFHVWWCSN